MNYQEVMTRNLQASIELKQQILDDEQIKKTVDAINDEIVKCFKNDGKVYFCGNGGSAADAQHLAAELSGRYYYDRPPLFSEALHCNTSYLTAVANDYSYDVIYARLLHAMGKKGDILIGLSTSGNSANVVKGMEEANARGMITIGWTGASGGKLKGICDYMIQVPSTDTPRIQECHMLIGHSICEVVEARMFPR